ncbi:hypothetical protein [Mesorhizobium sp. M0296]|uniref:hypothetical protein n=1 Tax=Mesorhizobium sp. M0296 TaxID=2956931 RepID=UPI003335618C
MSDNDDNELDDFDGDERLRAGIIRQARTVGIQVAFESALAVCRDPNAPAAAKASSQRTLLMVGGLLDRNDRNASAANKPLSEMDGAELEKATQDLMRRQRRSGAAAAKPVGSAFD